MSHLIIDELTVNYGAVRALNAVSLGVAKGETVALIGPNGAGKSSLLQAIGGVVTPQSGTITLGGRDLLPLPAEARVGIGVSLVLETRDVFKKLDVRENLMIGASRRALSRAELMSEVERMYALFPRLAERREHMAGFLSGGEQQMLAIGRALMARPELLMLDEPSLGLAPVVTDTVYEAIARLKAEGTTIIVVEQNSERAFGVCDRAWLMRGGEIVEEGTPAELIERRSVETVLFGKGGARPPVAATITEGASA